MSCVNFTTLKRYWDWFETCVIKYEFGWRDLKQSQLSGDRRRSFRGACDEVQIAGREPGLDTDYGLSSAIFGRDVTRALAVARQIESGCVHINGARRSSGAVRRIMSALRLSPGEPVSR
jgi:hypothetical protein